MEETALSTLRTMMGRRKLETATERVTTDAKKMEKVTLYTIGTILVCFSQKDKVLAGFAGGTADAFTLFERFEQKLEKHQGHLVRSAVEMAKDWRSDKMLRRLEALLAVADETASLIITGNGDVIEPEHGIIAIGSGGPYALAAARAMVNHSDLSAADIVKNSLNIAADICIYSNHNLTLEQLDY